MLSGWRAISNSASSDLGEGAAKPAPAEARQDASAGAVAGAEGYREALVAAAMAAAAVDALAPAEAMQQLLCGAWTGRLCDSWRLRQTQLLDLIPHRTSQASVHQGGAAPHLQTT
jgi:hypothetical protein